MEIVIAVLIAVVVVGGIFLKIALSYGGVKAFTSKNLKSDREVLKAARKKAKSLAKAAAGELKSAVNKVKEEEKTYQRQIAKAEAEHELWANPGTGKSLVTLGRVTLYEHALKVGGDTVDLDGISVDSKITDMSSVFVVTLPNGIKLTESFDTSWKDGDTKYNTSSHKDWDIIESTTERKRSYSPDQIIHLANEINNQSVRRHSFLQRQPEMIEVTAKYVEAAKENTSALDQAKHELQALEAGSQTALDAKSAAEALVTAEETYKRAVSEKLAKKA